MGQDTWVAGVQRVLLLAAVALAALSYGPTGGVDGLSVGKASVVLFAALGCAAAALAGAVDRRRISIPSHPAVFVAGAFVGVLVVRAAVADNVALAFAGPIGRANGVGFYVACAVLFVGAAARSGPRMWRTAASTIVVVAILVGLSAVDEATLRLGPAWPARPGAAGTMGNANFLSSWAGIFLPVVSLVALDRSRAVGWRAAGAGAAALLLASLVVAASLQGWLVAVAVGVVLALVFAWGRFEGARFRVVLVATGAATFAAATLLVVGAAGNGPLRLLADQIGVRLRAEYWYAAVQMAGERPLAGVGPGRYGDFYREARGVEGANLVDLASTSDSAHSVPLQFAAEGGLAVALLYLVFLGLVAWAFLTALRSHTGRDRWGVGVVGAVWIGYVLQSFISIDVPQLAIVGWVAAGLLVGAAVSPVKAPVARVGGAPRARGRPHAAGQSSTRTPGQLVGAGLGVVLLGGAAVVASVPLRAEVAATSREVIAVDEAGPSAISRATLTAGYEVAYQLRLADQLIAAEERDRAEAVLLEAMEVNPRNFQAVVNAARLAVAGRDRASAEERYQRAIELEPSHVDLLTEAAEYVVRGAQVELAAELTAAVLAIEPEHEVALRLDQALRNPRSPGEGGEHDHGGASRGSDADAASTHDHAHDH